MRGLDVRSKRLGKLPSALFSAAAAAACGRWLACIVAAPPAAAGRLERYARRQVNVRGSRQPKRRAIWPCRVIRPCSCRDVGCAEPPGGGRRVTCVGGGGGGAAARGRSTTEFKTSRLGLVRSGQGVMLVVVLVAVGGGVCARAVLALGSAAYTPSFCVYCRKPKLALAQVLG